MRDPIFVLAMLCLEVRRGRRSICDLLRDRYCRYEEVVHI